MTSPGASARGFRAPLRAHHVLANAQLDHGVFATEGVWLLADEVHRLPQPRVAKGKGLVSSEGPGLNLKGCLRRHDRSPTAAGHADGPRAHHAAETRF
jgi:hypothetical protein